MKAKIRQKSSPLEYTIDPRVQTETSETLESTGQYRTTIGLK